MEQNGAVYSNGEPSEHHSGKNKSGSSINLQQYTPHKTR